MKIFKILKIIKGTSVLKIIEKERLFVYNKIN